MDINGDNYLFVDIDLTKSSKFTLKDGLFDFERLTGKITNDEIDFPINIKSSNNALDFDYVSFVQEDDNNAVFINNFFLSYETDCNGQKSFAPGSFDFISSKDVNCYSHFSSPLGNLVISNCDNLKSLDYTAKTFLNNMLNELASRGYSLVYSSNKKSWIFAVPVHTTQDNLASCPDLAPLIGSTEYGKLAIIKYTADVNVENDQQRIFEKENVPLGV